MSSNLIGWTAAAILLITLGQQVYVQWRDRTTQGVSHWLFIGQVVSSTGFVTYSWLKADLVFVLTNGAILITAIFGQYVMIRNSSLRETDANHT